MPASPERPEPLDQPATLERLVALEGSFNFRDLGGYPTTDGRLTRWGCLYRSDALHALTPADVAQLRRRRMATVIDLRTDTELERWGRGALGDELLRFAHLSVLRTDGGESVAAPDTDDMAQRYLWYLEVGGGALVEALALLAEPGVTPAVFHCAAGKDRTGVLAALILDAVGVQRPAIVADYVETAIYLDPILARLAVDVAPTNPPVPPSRYRVEAPTMERFLAELHRLHGGAAGWMIARSGDPSLPQRLSDLLLEG